MQQRNSCACSLVGAVAASTASSCWSLVCSSSSALWASSRSSRRARCHSRPSPPCGGAVASGSVGRSGLTFRRALVSVGGVDRVNMLLEDEALAYRVVGRRHPQRGALLSTSSQLAWDASEETGHWSATAVRAPVPPQGNHICPSGYMES
jgi:hypothetical protein